MRKFIITVILCGVVSLVNYQASVSISLDNDTVGQSISAETIENVTYDLSKITSEFNGIYNSCENMTFKNITIISNVQLSTSSDYMGTLCKTASNSSFEGVTNNVNLKNTSNYTGGIVGKGTNNVYTNVTNTGNITGLKYKGGISGDETNSDFVNVKNTGNLNGIATNSSSHIGGIVGLAKDSNITNAYNSGNIVATNSHLGGIVGRLEGGTLTDVENEGNIKGTYSSTASHSSNVGGIAGSAHNSNIHNATSGRFDSNGEITGVEDQIVIVNTNHNVGGIVGHFQWDDNFICLEQLARCGIVNAKSAASITSMGSGVGGIVGTIENVQTYEKENNSDNQLDNSQMYVDQLYSRTTYIKGQRTDGTLSERGGLIGRINAKLHDVPTNKSGNISFYKLVKVSNVSTDSLLEAKSAVFGKDEIGGLIGADNSVVYDLEKNEISNKLVGITRAIVNNVTVISNNKDGINIGGLVGLNNGTINDATVSSSVVVTSNGANVGGAIGTNNGHLSNIRLSCTVKGNRYLGGIAGVNNAQIYNVISTVKILPYHGGKNQDNYSQDAEYIGRLAGYQTKDGQLISNVSSPTMEENYQASRPDEIKEIKKSFIPSFHAYLGQSNEQTVLAQDRYNYYSQSERNAQLARTELEYVNFKLNIDEKNSAINGLVVSKHDIVDAQSAFMEQMNELIDSTTGINYKKDKRNIIYLLHDNQATKNTNPIGASTELTQEYVGYASPLAKVISALDNYLNLETNKQFVYADSNRIDGSVATPLLDGNGYIEELWGYTSRTGDRDVDENFIYNLITMNDYSEEVHNKPANYFLIEDTNFVD